MTIYRGYDIEQQKGMFVVLKNGEAVAPELFKSEDAAMDWVDQQKRKERGQS